MRTDANSEPPLAWPSQPTLQRFGFVALLATGSAIVLGVTSGIATYRLFVTSAPPDSFAKFGGLAGALIVGPLIGALVYFPTLFGLGHRLFPKAIRLRAEVTMALSALVLGFFAGPIEVPRNPTGRGAFHLLADVVVLVILQTAIAASVVRFVRPRRPKTFEPAA